MSLVKYEKDELVNIEKIGIILFGLIHLAISMDNFVYTIFTYSHPSLVDSKADY